VFAVRLFANPAKAFSNTLVQPLAVLAMVDLNCASKTLVRSKISAARSWQLMRVTVR
jgi:hypothetical protein